MFDATTVIEIDARTAAGGKSTLSVRWPTDEEWAARARGRKIFIRRLGRGVSETIIEPGESDLKLYEKIVQNGSAPLTQAEAARVVDALGQSDVQDVVIEGEQVAVTMAVLGGTVQHTMRIPTADQVTAYRRAAFRVLDLPHNKQEVRMLIDPGARLWDECGGRSSDYAGAVPGLHKDQAVKAVIDFLDREMGPKPDENF